MSLGWSDDEYCQHSLVVERSTRNAKVACSIHAVGFPCFFFFSFFLFFPRYPSSRLTHTATPSLRSYPPPLPPTCSDGHLLQQRVGRQDRHQRLLGPPPTGARSFLCLSSPLLSKFDSGSESSGLFRDMQTLSLFIVKQDSSNSRFSAAKCSLYTTSLAPSNRCPSPPQPAST